MGPPGAGKSTTAAAFAREGYPVLKDEALYGSPQALPQLTPTCKKCYLSLDGNGYKFQREPLPLRAVYLLAGRVSKQGAPHAAEISSGDSLIALVQNTYMNHLSDRERRTCEFVFFGRLLAHVRLRRVIPHLICIPRLI